MDITRRALMKALSGAGLVVAAQGASAVATGVARDAKSALLCIDARLHCVFTGRFENVVLAQDWRAKGVGWGFAGPRPEAIAHDGLCGDSAFMEVDGVTPTGLRGYLKERGIERVYIVGRAADGGAAATAADARRAGFEVQLIGAV